MKTDKSSESAANNPPGVVVERSGNILTFVLDNPENGNEVTIAMMEAMLSELRAEALDPQARVLRIRARGKVFCTGRERAGRNAEELRAESQRILEFKRALRTSPLISIAEVHGDAFGFGFGLAIVCDFVFVVETASLGFPEMRKGLAPAAILSYLGEYILPRHAFPLVLFGEPIDASRALQIGLVSLVCAADQLNREVEALANRVLRLEPSATRRCKEFFLAAQQNFFEQNSRLAVESLTVGSLAALSKLK